MSGKRKFFYLQPSVRMGLPTVAYSLQSICGLCLLLALPANAQVQRSGNDSARVAQQMQQFAAERLQLQSDNSALKKENEELKKKLDNAAAGSKALEQRARTLETTLKGRDTQVNQHGTEELEKSRAQLQELIARFRETAQSLRDVEQDRNEARTQLKTRDVEMKTCAQKNVQLADLANDALDRYEHKGVWTSLSQAEPFTALKRTEIQNLVDEYRAKVDDMRMRETAASQKPGG